LYQSQAKCKNRNFVERVYPLIVISFSFWAFGSLITCTDIYIIKNLSRGLPCWSLEKTFTA
jgi:hypothetical protein